MLGYPLVYPITLSRRGFSPTLAAPTHTREQAHTHILSYSILLIYFKWHSPLWITWIRNLDNVLSYLFGLIFKCCRLFFLNYKITFNKLSITYHNLEGNILFVLLSWHLDLVRSKHQNNIHLSTQSPLVGSVALLMSHFTLAPLNPLTPVECGVQTIFNANCSCFGV